MGKMDFNKITNRQAEVLKLLGEGHTSKEIAVILGVSKRTVDGHRLNLMRKTETRNAMELIAWAHKYGYVE
jgi:DNA-binding CsgD family transcriptional regulator